MGRCMTCQQTRKRDGPVKYVHFPASLWPFVNVQIDFVHMTQFHVSKYMLVITEMFSKWVEAFLNRKEDAKTVVKHLVKDIIPHYSVLMGINSNRGPAFVAKIT